MVKKLLNIFSNLVFYLKIQFCRLIMENNFLKMATSAGHAAAYTIGPIFKHIIDCMQLYYTNVFTNIVLESVNCLWLVDVILVFDGSSQIIVQHCEIATPRLLNDISSAADNAIFKNRAQSWNQLLPIASSSIFMKKVLFLYNFYLNYKIAHCWFTSIVFIFSLKLFLFVVIFIVLHYTENSVCLRFADYEWY